MGKAKRVSAAIDCSARPPRMRTPGGRHAQCEALEGRVMLDGVPRPRVDAGDFYYYGDAPFKLYRATDQVVLGLVKTTAKRARQLTARAVGAGGPLAGYSLKQKLSAKSYLFERSPRLRSPAYGKLLHRFADFPAFNFFSPTFFASPDGAGRIEIAEQIDVGLQPDADPANFFRDRTVFAGDFRAHGDNSYYVSLAHGGGLDVLKLAVALHGRSGVNFAEPSTFVEIIP